jgi:hypothetical protein
MATFLVSYDLQSTTPDPHTTMLSLASVYGWAFEMPCTDGITRRLPNTTLWGTFADMAAAERGFQSLVQGTAVALGRTVNAEKWVIVSYTDSRVLSDVRRKS